MNIDYEPFFKKYEAIAAKVDEAFRRISEAHPELVKCSPGCTDCCYALFDLTLIEAMYLNHHFNAEFTGETREALLEKAGFVDRKIFKLKKAAYKANQEGKTPEAVVEEMARERIRCPLLNENMRCDLYPHRPLACRIYGVPLAIGGAGRTCGMSGFAQGERYPTVNMDTLHTQLLILSSELVQTIGTKYANLAEVLLPVSMVLMTRFDEEFLGLSSNETVKETMDGGE